MSGICEAAVNKSVGHKQVAIFIMDARDGDRQSRQKSKPDSDDEEEKSDDRQSLALCKAGKKCLNNLYNS